MHSRVVGERVVAVLLVHHGVGVAEWVLVSAEAVGLRHKLLVHPAAFCRAQGDAERNRLPAERADGAARQRRRAEAALERRADGRVRADLEGIGHACAQLPSGCESPDCAAVLGAVDT